MKTPERFDRALKALVQAFLNDTLERMDACGCAVGNIVAAGYGLKTVNHPAGFITMSNRERDNMHWINHRQDAPIADDKYMQIGLDNIQVTGYSAAQLFNIEKAFMQNTHSSAIFLKTLGKKEYAETCFRGLMAVVDVLCQIEGLDAEPYKKAFEYNQDLTPVYQS